MSDKDYHWEVSGSLTPELEGTPHSGMHKKRVARRTNNLPDHVIPEKNAKSLEYGINSSD